MLFFQHPSLLEYQRRMKKQTERSNLERVFQVDRIPSDPQMQEILDGVPPEPLRRGGPPNKGYKASLEVGKLYQVIPDNETASHGYIRVVDGSGEDYGYAADRFFPLAVPQALADALQMAG